MLQQVKEHLHHKLVEQGYDNPDNTTLVLLSHILNQPKSFILAHNEYLLSSKENQSLQEIIDQISKEIPLPYILGEWEFFGRIFVISAAVLIPRPETELLVEKAIQLAQSYKNPRIVDVGTGSGAIIVSLASHLPSGTLIGTDVSFEALKIAQLNAKNLGQSHIKFLQADLLTPIYTQFDLICANLPYIPSNTLDGLAVVKSEPRLALDGGEDGLNLIRTLITQAQTRLAPKGALLLEIEASMGRDVLSIAKNVFPAATSKVFQDLAGKDRLVVIQST